MKAEYPCMLYLGGDTAQKYRIVDDAEAERAAGGDGFYRPGRKPSAPLVAEPRKPAGRPKRGK